MIGSSRGGDSGSGSGALCEEAARHLGLAPHPATGGLSESAESGSVARGIGSSLHRATAPILAPTLVVSTTVAADHSSGGAATGTLASGQATGQERGLLAAVRRSTATVATTAVVKVGWLHATRMLPTATVERAAASAAAAAIERSPWAIEAEMHMAAPRLTAPRLTARRLTARRLTAPRLTATTRLRMIGPRSDGR